MQKTLILSAYVVLGAVGLGLMEWDAADVDLKPVALTFRRSRSESSASRMEPPGLITAEGLKKFSLQT